ncbi:MAG: hypothetical protein K8H87_00885 [Pseudorhodoplanes sp.]|nr:MAG: hypothetical protein F9K43_02215 [Bauldia sp.]MBZ0138312.1 hypothetical protein [Pseudorhodoplanes sp.]
MSDITKGRSVRIAAYVAIIFGLLTILSGGRALFGAADMGAVVPFVLWFNFVAGFAYVLAGIGLFGFRSWAKALSIAIFAATCLVALAFAVHALLGGAYEMRTVGALILRAGVWGGIAVTAIRALRRPR